MCESIFMFFRLWCFGQNIFCLQRSFIPAGISSPEHYDQCALRLLPDLIIIQSI